MEPAAGNGVGKDATTNHQWECERQAVAGNNKSERTAGGNGGKRGWRLEERLSWPKRSDLGIGGGRGILDLDDKDACS
jgi:hypothetical protein